MSGVFVGIQVGAISFIDEGVAPTLDRFSASGINALCISALSWSRGNAGRASRDYPDHGPAEADELKGGAFFKYDSRYLEATSLKYLAAPDPLYAGFDALGDVIPEAKRRGMAVYPYYCETAHTTPRPLWQPGFSQVLEVDAFGRKATRPCLRNPDYRSFWTGVIENWIREYDIDGVMWGIELQSPLSAMVVDADVPTCFCEHCRGEAHRRGIDSGRAAEGYRRLHASLASARRGERPLDGYLISFWRLLAEYPEVGQWEKLWLDGHKARYREISGLVRYFGDQLKVGLGIWQMIDTFNPYLRAQHDPAEYAMYADWVKPVLYHVPAGARFRAFVDKLASSVLRDAPAADWLPLIYRVLGIDEAAYDDLASTGFSARYVGEQVKRYAKALGPSVGVYPGIGVGFEAGERKLTPADVSSAIEASFEGGATGVIVSRNYSEMTLDGLAAIGDTLRRLGQV